MSDEKYGLVVVCLNWKEVERVHVFDTHEDRAAFQTGLEWYKPDHLEAYWLPEVLDDPAWADELPEWWDAADVRESFELALKS